MTYNALVPLNSDSPAIFPAQAQANFTRLQTIISANHVFNLTAQADDGYHNVVTLTQQAPSGILAAVGRLYAKTADGRVNLFYMDDQATDYQITPTFTVLSGTVNVATDPTYNTITAIPINVFGEILMWKGRFIQGGSFVSDATQVDGYSYAEKYVSGSGASQILNLGFGANASGLNLRVTNNSGASFNGSWSYKVFYRAK